MHRGNGASTADCTWPGCFHPNLASPEARVCGKSGGKSEPIPAPGDTPQVELLPQRYADHIVGTLGCWDRVILTGTLTDVCHAGAVEGWLRRDNIRCFDLKGFAEPLRDAVRDHAILTARAAGLTIEHIERKNFRKEDRVAEVL